MEFCMPAVKTALDPWCLHPSRDLLCRAHLGPSVLWCPNFGAEKSRQILSVKCSVAMVSPPPAVANSTRHPSLTQDLQQHTLAAVAHGVAGHTLVGAPVVCWVSISDLEAQLGTCRVQHKS